MPPKASTMEGIILSYMNEQNRPLNIQVVADALQKHGIKKTAVQKVLDTLSENGTVSFKEFGKQKIYLAKQDQFEVPTTDELEKMKKENDKLQQDLASNKARITELETVLRSVETNLTDSQVKERTQKLTDEITAMQLNLSKVKDGTTVVKPEQKKKVEELYDQKVGLWRKRKRMFKEIWDMITESMPKNLNEFREELGIEYDDDVGVQLEDYCNLAVKKQRR